MFAWYSMHYNLIWNNSNVLKILFAHGFDHFSGLLFRPAHPPIFGLLISLPIRRVFLILRLYYIFFYLSINRWLALPVKCVILSATSFWFESNSRTCWNFNFWLPHQALARWSTWSSCRCYFLFMGLLFQFFHIKMHWLFNRHYWKIKHFCRYFWFNFLNIYLILSWISSLLERLNPRHPTFLFI